MVQVILGVVLTGGILYVAQFVAMATLAHKFLICCFLAMVFFALITTSKDKPQWVFLKKINGDDLTKTEFACVSFAASAVLLGLVLLAYQFQIPTLFVTLFMVIVWNSFWPWLKKQYADAKEKRKEKMAEYKKNPPVPVKEWLKQHMKAPPSDDIQEEAMNDILGQYENL